MTQKEYAQYLGGLIGEEIDVSTSHLDDQFYGYFQAFMPAGKGLEKVFEPLENGSLYYDRVIQIFDATEAKSNQLAEAGQMAAYFCPPAEADDALLQENANKYLANLRKFAPITDDEEFIDTVNQVNQIEIRRSGESDRENDANLIVYEAICDWFINHTDFKDTEEILSEAFYSINCDYYLAYYFRHPAYAKALGFDLFEPYFKIWAMGFGCWLEENKLVVGV